jgi:hypothetical protein
MDTDAPRQFPGPAEAQADAPSTRFVCPFCGESEATDVACNACGARTDPLSRQATQNEMGPWFVRDTAHPHRPGCRLETIERWARNGKITPETVLRGPSTAQNWAPARRVPGVARLFGRCHACAAEVQADEISCRGCGAHLHAERDRQHLGLSPVRDLPGRGDPGSLADRLLLNEPKFRPAGMGTPDRGSSESETHAHHSGAERTHGLGGSHSATSREKELARRLIAARRRSRAAVVIAAAALGVAGMLAYLNWSEPSATGRPNASVSTDTVVETTGTTDTGPKVDQSVLSDNPEDLDSAEDNG